MENDSFGSSSSDPESMGEQPIMMRDIVNISPFQQSSSSELGDGSTSVSSSSSSALSSSSSSEEKEEEEQEEEEDEETHRTLHARANVSKAADLTSGAPNLKSRLEKSGRGSSERGKDSGLRGRVWSEEDEIALLQGIRDNLKKTGRQPSEDLTALLASLQGKLSRDMSKSQVYEKIRRLKNKFFNQAPGGKELESGDNHISKVFLLCKNIWGSNINSIEMEEDISDLMMKSVLQELNASGMENNIKQLELNCSTGSFLGGADDPVSCAREISISATKDECPTDHNTTSKPKNTLAEQEKESEMQNMEIAEGCSKLRTLDLEVGILQNIGPEDEKALHARSGNNDMSQEGARNQQTEESTVNMFSHGVCVEAACPNNLVQSVDVRSEDSDKKTKKRKKAKDPNEESSSNDNVQEKTNQKAINGSMVQNMSEQKLAYDKFPHEVSEVAARPNDLVQSSDIRSGDPKTKKRKKTKLSKRKSLGEDSFDNVQEKIDQSTNGRSMAQNLTEQKPAYDKGTDLYAHKKKKKQEIKGDKNVEDLHAKSSQKSTPSNANFIIEELAADEPDREAVVPKEMAMKKRNKQEIEDNENVHARSNDYSKDDNDVRNLHAKANDDSIVEEMATGESHGEIATLGKKLKKHKQEITGDKNVENLQRKSNDDSIIDVLAAGEPHGEVADPGKKLKKKKKHKQEIKDNENIENLHGKSNHDLIMDVPEAGEPDAEVVAQRKKVKKKKKEEIKEKNLYAKANDGLIIEVLAAGDPDGEVAAFGKKVGIFYTVRIKGSGSVIDSNVGGKPLKYCIGDEKVVKGWSIAVDGMHVGEKRRVSFPPSMGYGKRFVEVIPENSWVEGDIELVSVR